MDRGLFVSGHVKLVFDPKVPTSPTGIAWRYRVRNRRGSKETTIFLFPPRLMMHMLVT